MAKQTLTFVALPNGPSPRGLKLSIHMTPRLEDGTILGDFPDLLDWTDLIKRHGLRLTLKCGGHLFNASVDQGPLRPDLWREIFLPRTLVSPPNSPDFDQRLLVSYPVSSGIDYLKYVYQLCGIGLLATEREGLRHVLSDLVFRDEGGSTLDATLSQLRVELWKEQLGERLASSPRAAPLTKPANARDTAARFALYHHMPAAPNRPPLPQTAGDFATLIDFHQALATVSAYPALQRALGLVFDVEVPSALCPLSPTSGPAWPFLEVSAVTAGFAFTLGPTLCLPRTAYRRTAQSFGAAPAASPDDVAARAYPPGDVVDGLLALSPSLFQLVNVDVDGGLLQLLGLADNAVNATRAPVEDVLPALRSGGLSLIANQRAQELLDAISDNKLFEEALRSNAPLPRALNARDVVRGYRLDVWASATGRWHSLHRRDSSYRFGADGALHLAVADEEGFTQLAVTQPADDPTRAPDPVATSNGVPQPGTDIYVHERVARWNGWSLSAQRPGGSVNRSPDPALATAQDPTVNQPLTPFKMTTEFQVHPGSLPRLRFGNHYRMRVRAVDLAGNSIPLKTPAPAALITPPGGATIPYLRFEPVPTPIVVQRAAPLPGGSLEHLVIRSANATPDLDQVRSTVTDERHIAPPRASVKMAELHGLLDGADGRLKGDAATYAMLSDRDRAELPTTNGVPMVPGQTVTVTWLPDPFARGAALVAVPGTDPATLGEVRGGALVYATGDDVERRTVSVTHIGFGAAWPERQAFRIVLAEGKQAPRWDDGARVLTVYLSKGEEAQIALGSFLDSSDLPVMGVWSWLRELFEASEQDSMGSASAGRQLTVTTDEWAKITRLVLDGGHYMITPARVLTLTHAVQQPLGHPEWTLLPTQPSDASLANRFAPMTAWRSRNSHHAVLFGALRIHGKSSAQVSLHGEWIEVNDDPSQPAPTRTPAGDHVETIPLHSLSGGMIAVDAAATRYVAVYLPGLDVLWFATDGETLPGASSPWTVAAPVHRFGDTKHRRVRYRATATSRFRECFTDPGLTFDRQSEPLLVSVPSSARPLAPDIAYVVPLFGWQQQEATNVKTTVRHGNALRVYLKRPWYSSGEGELLGVVLWPASRPSPDDDAREKYKPYFTQWGLDPLWETGPLNDVPSRWQFPLARATGEDLTLDGSGLAVDVAGHAVAFDADRKLWYCDIVVDNPDAYTPMVRLALARHQPRSIAGAELSNVVLAEFAQIMPDRSAALSIDPANPARMRVFVGGLAPTSPTSNTITVVVQRRQAHVESDLGWEDAPPAVASVTEDSPAPSNPHSVLWAGTILFVAPPGPGDFRVVVREYEPLTLDGSAGQRLIYAATIACDFPSRASKGP